MKPISDARTCIADNNVLNRFNLASSRFEVEGVEGVEGSVEKHGGRFLNEAYLRRTYLRGRLHVLAGKEAVHCRDGCSALQGRMQCTASEMGITGTEIASPVLNKR